MEIQGYNMPDDLYYEENHFWVREEGDLLVMGLDDFGQKMAGDIVYIQLPAEGKKLKAGKSFAKMESGKWLGKVYAPVNGELEEINEELEINPALINEDSYGEGWMYKIRPDDKSELDNLIHGPEAVEKWLLAEIEKYKEEGA
ncbi:MAG: glycine cleavage system protein GcvH [Deltaproteobacteria bacterium]|nr:glycine cleavage system protein GcvH [Deltaproteobacteria bacterium]